MHSLIMPFVSRNSAEFCAATRAVTWGWTVCSGVQEAWVSFLPLGQEGWPNQVAGFTMLWPPDRLHPPHIHFGISKDISVVKYVVICVYKTSFKAAESSCWQVHFIWNSLCSLPDPSLGKGFQLCYPSSFHYWWVSHWPRISLVPATQHT